MSHGKCSYVPYHFMTHFIPVWTMEYGLLTMNYMPWNSTFSSMGAYGMTVRLCPLFFFSFFSGNGSPIYNGAIYNCEYVVLWSGHRMRVLILTFTYVGRCLSRDTHHHCKRSIRNNSFNFITCFVSPIATSNTNYVKIISPPAHWIVHVRPYVSFKIHCA